MRFSHIGLGALPLALATPAFADPMPANPAPTTAPAASGDQAPAPVAAPAAPAPVFTLAPMLDPAPAPQPVATVEDETAPPPMFTFNGSVALVSDYRFRGISQTNKRFAVQGGMSVTHSSGAYVSIWGSSIDDYVANGSDQEIDFIGGFKKTYKGTTFDIGVLYYYYPGSGENCIGAGEGGPICAKYYSDFVEPYFDVAHTFGPLTAKVTLNYAPSQRALSLGNGNKDNLYGALDFSLAVPKTPLGLTAHLGHNFIESFLSAGRTYTDWGIGATATYKQFTIGVSYVDTDLPDHWAVSQTGKDVASPGVVGSFSVAF